MNITFTRKPGSSEIDGDPERYSVIVKISCSNNSVSSDCFFWDLSRGTRPATAADIKESTITTKQWYMLRATYRYMYHGQRIASEFSIISMSNPTFTFFLFNDDLAASYNVTVELNSKSRSHQVQLYLRHQALTDVSDCSRCR